VPITQPSPLYHSLSLFPISYSLVPFPFYPYLRRCDLLTKSVCDRTYENVLQYPFYVITSVRPCRQLCQNVWQRLCVRFFSLFSSSSLCFGLYFFFCLHRRLVGGRLTPLPVDNFALRLNMSLLVVAYTDKKIKVLKSIFGLKTKFFGLKNVLRT